MNFENFRPQALSAPLSWSESSLRCAGVAPSNVPISPISLMHLPAQTRNVLQPLQATSMALSHVPYLQQNAQFQSQMMATHSQQLSAWSHQQGVGYMGNQEALSVLSQNSKDGGYKPGRMKKCVHGRRQACCKLCGGSQVCEHGKLKHQCRECRGSGICPHSKRFATCKQCGGSQICSHGRRKEWCKDCGGSGLCMHGKRKARCKECPAGLATPAPSSSSSAPAFSHGVANIDHAPSSSSPRAQPATGTPVVGDDPAAELQASALGLVTPGFARARSVLSDTQNATPFSDTQNATPFSDTQNATPFSDIQNATPFSDIQNATPWTTRRVPLAGASPQCGWGDGESRLEMARKAEGEEGASAGGLRAGAAGSSDGERPGGRGGGGLGRRQCEHGRRHDRCQQCGGSQICEHGKRRNQCRDCGGSAFCAHGRRHAVCPFCGGSQICAHAKRKDLCKECRVGMCPHGKRKNRCRQCKAGGAEADSGGGGGATEEAAATQGAEQTVEQTAEQTAEHAGAGGAPVGSEEAAAGVRGAGGEGGGDAGQRRGRAAELQFLSPVKRRMAIRAICDATP